MDARKCTPVKYHINSYLGSKKFTELSFIYIAHGKLYTFYVRNYILCYTICIHQFQMPQFIGYFKRRAYTT